MLWAVSGKRGTKKSALQAWLNCGSPDPAKTSIVWTAYMASLESWRNPKDLSSWLNGEMHLQEYGPPPPEKRREAPKPWAVREEEERQRRLLEKRLERLQEMGIIRPRRETAEVPDEIRALADGKAIS